MQSGRVLPRSFYARHPTVVARELLGAFVQCTTSDGLVAVRIVEAEAYAGQDDPASHAWRGPTPRSEIMFGRPGHAYVYFSYGLHWALNVVCGPPGTAAAVLLRAGEVVDGSALARRRRGPTVADRRLASGPANLASALGLDGSWNGTDLTVRGSSLSLRGGTSLRDDEVLIGPRVGITRGADTPWRYWVAGNPYVSGPRRARGWAT
jgi:DNA-3-methyladenine glycosylase